MIDYGGRGLAKITESVIFPQILIQKARTQKQKVGEGGGRRREGEGGGGVQSIHFLKALFKAYSKINVWWLLLSE